MTLDENTIQQLLGLEDEIGILSFYASHTPEEAAAPQPVAPLELRNQVKDLLSAVRDAGPHDRVKAVDKRLDELNDDLDWLVEARTPGRGRVLFAGVAGDVLERMTFQVPFRTRAILHDHAFVRPLVAALDEGRAAGIAIAHRRRVRILEWHMGEASELDGRTFEPPPELGARMKEGPAANIPGKEQSGFSNRERHEQHVDDLVTRFLHGVAEELPKLASKRGWDRLVVGGDAKARTQLVEGISANGSLTVLPVDAAWEAESPQEVADAVWPTLRDYRYERERQLVAAARDRALSGGAGAVGLRNVLNALNQSKVSHLLFKTDLEVGGYRTEDGQLLAQVGGLPAEAGTPTSPEPFLIERMVEKAMETGAAVTPIEPEAADQLDEHDGVAALLRW